MFALTVLTLGVFLLRARYPDDTADVVISSAVGDQHTQQTLGVEPIGLGAASTAVHQDTCRLHHVVGDPMGNKKAMQPKAVTPRFEAACDNHLDATKLRRNLRLQLLNQL
jgi:hypothetical protein